MTRTKKAGPAKGLQGPRFTQFRCKGTTLDGTEITRGAMKARLYRNGVVVFFKGRGPDGRKGSFVGVFNSAEELAALELAARMARDELQKLLVKTLRGAGHE